ncbi:bifunctional P-450:NADPH-P450 reductase [Lecanosticta acicola]|uniref:Bifunctional P-450:NADPH-P450 reductase n=1 Tax=Lecanosticta acicola TaxID=111012 RepID=A0AAI9EE50_9PEZI|nr:bifunctional P-450:NADPH-P450 reductase [Lecanosticta acicola]
MAAETGIAPFRGFIHERAAQYASGRRLAPAYLYYGCQRPDRDDLYREELDLWEKLGLLQCTGHTVKRRSSAMATNTSTMSSEQRRTCS